MFFIRAGRRRVYGVGELLLKATPLMLIALGLAVGFRANVWNIGAEGQLTMGAIAGGGVALRSRRRTAAGCCCRRWSLAGALGGMLWAAIPAFLRTRFNANEILVSLMLVYVAALLLSLARHGPWRDPEGFNFPQSKLFADSALLPILCRGDAAQRRRVLIALAAVAVGWLFVRRHIVGFQMRVAGWRRPRRTTPASHAKRAIWLGMLAGGACAGLAGVGEAAGPIGQLLPTVSPGYGFAAIIVAFVGRLHPVGIVFASLLMSLLYLGGEAAQMSWRCRRR